MTAAILLFVSIVHSIHCQAVSPGCDTFNYKPPSLSKGFQEYWLLAIVGVRRWPDWVDDNPTKIVARPRDLYDFIHFNRIRIVEPLSFRRTRDSNKLFYGYEPEEGKPKAFSLSKMQEVTITNTPYREREWAVEINASGHVVMPPLSRKK